MASLAALLVVAILVWFVISILRRRGHGIVARRGISVGADLGALADAPRVRIRAVTKAGPDRIRLVLTPESDPINGPRSATPSDLDFVVFLREEDFGFGQLHEWHRSASPLALMLPPGNRLVRLRSIDDLQPLSLRRVDER